MYSVGQSDNSLIFLDFIHITFLSILCNKHQRRSLNRQSFGLLIGCRNLHGVVVGSNCWKLQDNQLNETKSSIKAMQADPDLWLPTAAVLPNRKSSREFHRSAIQKQRCRTQSPIQKPTRRRKSGRINHDRCRWNGYLILDDESSYNRADHSW